MLQFDVSKKNTEGAIDEDDEFADPESADNARKAMTRAKLSLARAEIVRKYMFPVLYDLREKLKEHASTVQPQLFQLMSGK